MVSGQVGAKTETRSGVSLWAVDDKTETRSGVSLWAVDDKTNEIAHVIPLLRDLVLKGRIFTMDALLTQRALAQTILDGGGDYVMLAKGNQPDLEADVALVFTEPPEDDLQLQAESVVRAHGRIERRRLNVSAAPADYSDWPGLQQVFCIDWETFLLLWGYPSNWSLDASQWVGLRDLIRQTYDLVGKLHRETAHEPLVEHEFLTPDYQVQRSRFGDGTAIQVNFGMSPYALPDGRVIPARGYLTDGPALGVRRGAFDPGYRDL